MATPATVTDDIPTVKRHAPLAVWAMEERVGHDMRLLAHKLYEALAACRARHRETVDLHRPPRSRRNAREHNWNGPFPPWALLPRPGGGGNEYKPDYGHGGDGGGGDVGDPTPGHFERGDPGAEGWGALPGDPGYQWEGLPTDNISNPTYSGLPPDNTTNPTYSPIG